MNYANVTQLEQEIEGLKHKIDMQKKKNATLSKQIEIKLSAIPPQPRPQLQPECAEYPGVAKVQNMDSENALCNAKARITKVSELLQRCKNLFEECQTPVSSRTGIYKLEGQIQKTRTLLMHKIDELIGLSRKTIFNLDVSKVLTCPENTDLWCEQLPPEQVSVLLDYVKHIVRVFTNLYGLPTPCRFDVRENAIYDMSTGVSHKLVETNYMAYKKDETLRAALAIFCVLTESIDLSLSSKENNANVDTDYDKNILKSLTNLFSRINMKHVDNSTEIPVIFRPGSSGPSEIPGGKTQYLYSSFIVEARYNNPDHPEVKCEILYHPYSSRDQEGNIENLSTRIIIGNHPYILSSGENKRSDTIMIDRTTQFPEWFMTSSYRFYTLNNNNRIYNNIDAGKTWTIELYLMFQ